jgi:hypothetical protein
MDYICSPDPFQDIELARISHDVKQRFYNLPAVAEATRMTASGHSRPMRSKLREHLCPLLPESGQTSRLLGRPLCAISSCEQAQHVGAYSITSSARGEQRRRHFQACTAFRKGPEGFSSTAGLG